MKVGDKVRILDAEAMHLDAIYSNGDIVEVIEVDTLGYGTIDRSGLAIYHNVPEAWEIVSDEEMKRDNLFTVQELKDLGKEDEEMTTEEYFEFIEELHKSMVSLVRKKNADYTGGVSPFANFKASEAFGVDPIVGLSVRMGDKMQRLQSYCKNGKLEVDGEGVREIAYDFIGYSWLLLGMLEEKKLKGE